MASDQVKKRELAGEDLTGKVWTAEKPYMLVKNDNGNMAVSFYVSKEDFDCAVRKAQKYNIEILNAAKIHTFEKIGDYKSGFGRNEEVVLEDQK